MDKVKDNSEIVYEIIKKEIIDATRKPGDIFNEKEFAANMGISRTPVREAVLRLSNEGLLVVMPRRGTFVSHISMADVRDMYQVRKILEPQIASIAAQKCDKDIVKQWRNFFKEEKTTGKSHSKDCIHPGNKTLDVYSDSDALFHIFIIFCPDKLGNNDTHSGRQTIYQHQEHTRNRTCRTYRAHCCISDKIADNQRIRHIIKALQNQGTCDRQRKHQQFFCRISLRKIPDSFFLSNRHFNFLLNLSNLFRIPFFLRKRAASPR